MKRSQPRRNWEDAREKVEQEGKCRLCSERWGLEAAHIIGRKRDFYCPLDFNEGPSVRILGAVQLDVHPLRIVPLCKRHHDAVDGRSHESVDLLPYLTLDEQLQAVADAGGIEQARVRLCPSQYRKAEAA